jgi:hypothetical protein
MPLFAVQTGFGEPLYLTRDDRWAGAGDLDILLFTHHADCIGWIVEHWTRPLLCARSPIAVDYAF